MQEELPNKSAAVVEDKKIIEYLLNENHPVGGSKAKFFLSKGYNVNDIRAFRKTLLYHANNNAVKSIKTTPYGTTYIIEGYITHYGYPGYPSNLKNLKEKPTVFNLRTIWSIGNNDFIPKLVTAYPI